MQRQDLSTFEPPSTSHPVRDANRADPLLMTIPEAARRAGIGVRQLRRAVRLDEVDSVAIGGWPRVYWDSVVMWISRQRVRPTEDVKQKAAEAVERRLRRSRSAARSNEDRERSDRLTLAPPLT